MSTIDVLSRVPDKILIGGTWRKASDGRMFDVVDPADGRLIKSVADATGQDGLSALEAAVTASDGWARTPARVRAEILLRAFELVQDRSEELAWLMTLEMGKPLEEARSEVVYGSEFLRWYSEEAVRVYGRYLPQPEGGGRMTVTHHPVGPCLLITPWNFPMAMATRKLAPAIAAGCTVVVKPAELTPLTTLTLAALLQEAGLPPGVVNVVTTSRPTEIADAIIADPRLRKLSFTGSTEVGVGLLRKAADGILRTSMELGGNAPFLVFDDADIDLAVDGAMKAKFRNVGQACTAANRFLVQRDVAAKFEERLVEQVSSLRVGRGVAPETTVGPLINARAVAKVSDLVSDAKRCGARVALGGAPIDGPGTFFAPTVLADVPPTARLLKEETFGPVVAILPFQDEDEAVRLANATDYGLAGYVFTRDLARTQRIVERLQTGMVGVNTGLISNAAAPFGGWKRSGIGREGGPEGLHEYLEMKYTLTGDPFVKDNR